MDEAGRPRPAGRPKDLNKREAILDSARRHFFAHGYEAVKVEAVAADAGVSKVTVYAHFGDKLTLFEEMVRRECERAEAAARLARESPDDLKQALEAFGVWFLGFTLSPEVVAIEGLFAAEGRRHPELARRFYEAGPGRCLEMLADIIRRGQERGQLTVADPLAAAEDLTALWSGVLPLRMSWGLGKPLGKRAISSRARRGVERFCRLYGCA